MIFTGSYKKKKSVYRRRDVVMDFYSVILPWVAHSIHIKHHSGSHRAQRTEYRTKGKQQQNRFWQLQNKFCFLLVNKFITMIQRLFLLYLIWRKIIGQPNWPRYYNFCVREHESIIKAGFPKFWPPPHTGLWSLGRWHLSHKFGKFESWVKVIIFVVYKHSW